MNTTVEKDNPKIFPKNKNSKGMIAPPVPPKSHQTKFAGMKAIFERNAPHFQANDSNKTVSSNLGRTFGPTMQKLMEDGDINIHVSASTPSKQRRNSGDSGISSCSDVSGRISDDEDRVIENINAFDQDNHQKSFDLRRVQAADELGTIKFLKTPSKKEREDLGFSPKQQNNQKVETSRKTYNPLDWNPIYQGKKHFSLGNMSSSSSSCSEKSNISDISDKSNNSNIVRCNITRSNSKQDFCKPDASYKQDPSSGVSEVNVDYVRNRVKRLIDQFEQSGRSC